MLTRDTDTRKVARRRCWLLRTANGDDNTQTYTAGHIQHTHIHSATQTRMERSLRARTVATHIRMGTPQTRKNMLIWQRNQATWRRGFRMKQKAPGTAIVCWWLDRYSLSRSGSQNDRSNEPCRRPFLLVPVTILTCFHFFPDVTVLEKVFAE